jgi:hypothetical protein
MYFTNSEHNYVRNAYEIFLKHKMLIKHILFEIQYKSHTWNRMKYSCFNKVVTLAID